MSFIKRGDGKILSVHEEEELDEKSKKSAKLVSEKFSQQQKEKDNSESNKLEKN